MCVISSEVIVFILLLLVMRISMKFICNSIQSGFDFFKCLEQIRYISTKEMPVGRFLWDLLGLSSANFDRIVTVPPNICYSTNFEEIILRLADRATVIRRDHRTHRFSSTQC